MPIEPCDGIRGGATIPSSEITPLFRVELGGDLGLSDEVAEEDRQLPALTLQTRNRWGRRFVLRPPLDPCAALRAKLRTKHNLSTTLNAANDDAPATLDAELRLGGILVPAGFAGDCGHARHPG